MTYNVKENANDLRAFRAIRISRIHEMTRGKKEYDYVLFNMLDKQVNAIDTIFEMAENTDIINLENDYFKRIVMMAWRESNDRKNFFEKMKNRG